MSFERYIFLLFLYKQISSRGDDDRNDYSICADNGLTDNKCIATTTEYNGDGTINRYVNYHHSINLKQNILIKNLIQ